LLPAYISKRNFLFPVGEGGGTHGKEKQNSREKGLSGTIELKTSISANVSFEVKKAMKGEGTTEQAGLEETWGNTGTWKMK